MRIEIFYIKMLYITMTSAYMHNKRNMLFHKGNLSLQSDLVM